jgi:hypothetical protein
VVLSLDVPDIGRIAPTGTCWPLIGTVILTPCNTEDENDDDDDICDADAFDVVFALGVVNDDDDDGCISGWSGSCNAFFDDVKFVFDVFDDGIIGN